MGFPRRGLAALLVLVAGLTAAGCGAGSSISDSKIVSALDLQHTSRGYEIGGDPFCTVTELLNDSGEVDDAVGKGGQTFVIAGPDSEVGVLAHKPFAPDCTRHAKDDLKKLERQQG